jgi:hypothetical protein
VNTKRRGLAGNILEIVVELVVGFFVVLDAIVRPLFGPVVRFLSSLRIVHRIEAWIASLNPYVIFVLIAAPFAVAELTKVYAVILMAEEHFRLGMSLFIGAYVVSILVCERIFHAGKDQLLTLGWFKWGYDRVMLVKDAIVGWIVKTQAWQAVSAFRERVKLGWRRLRTRLRVGFARRDAPAKLMLDKGVRDQRH